MNKKERFGSICLKKDIKEKLCEMLDVCKSEFGNRYSMSNMLFDIYRMFKANERNFLRVLSNFKKAFGDMEVRGE